VLDDLTILFYRFPGIFRALGKSLFSVAGFCLITGAYVSVGKMAGSIVTDMAGQPPVTDAAALWPGLWTGWIPESIAGAALYLFMAATGFWLAIAAKDAKRCMRGI
jgi:hypothetical protein